MKNESGSLAGQIGRASIIIIVWSLIDKILAIAKEMLTAHRFGISASLDVFNLAYSFPGTIVLLTSGALLSAFVPLYMEWRNRSKKEADSHTTWLIYLSCLIFALLSLVCFIFTPGIIQMIGYGFAKPEKDLAVVMERLLILLIFIDGAGILLRGILIAKKQFFHQYVAPIFVNLTLIFLLVVDMGLDIYVLVWGFLIGTLLKTIYMGIAVYQSGFRYRITQPYDPLVMKKFWLLAIPMLGSQLIANSNLMVDHIMATQLPTGGVSTLRYAFRINDLPIQVVIIAISRAIFPFISEEAASGNRERLQAIFKYSITLLGFLTIPITSLMLLFSEDVVILLLKRGAFDLEAARLTGQTLACYSVGLFFYAYTFINGTFFAALQNTKALLNMGIVSIFLNVIFNFLFMHIWGVKGIAISTSVTMGVISIWFIFLLKKNLGITNLFETVSNLFRILMAAAGMFGAGLLLVRLFELTPVPRIIFVPIAAAMASICYLGFIWMFRTPDIATCITVLTDKIKQWKR
ncbi:MAG: murein biosynthesis integral membrane protein MurJ [Desulfatirhabdiaceae bacterium]